MNMQGMHMNIQGMQMKKMKKIEETVGSILVCMWGQPCHQATSATMDSHSRVKKKKEKEKKS